MKSKVIIILATISAATSSYAGTFEDKMLKMCSAIKSELPHISGDCVGPCENKEGGNYLTTDVNDLINQIELKGFKEGCATAKKSDRQLYCQCVITKKNSYKSVLKQSCKQDSKKVYLTDNFFNKTVDTIATSRTTKFHNRLTIYFQLLQILKQDPPKCLSNINAPKLLADINHYTKQDYKSWKDYLNTLSLPPANFNITPDDQKQFNDAVAEFDPCQEINKLEQKSSELKQFIIQNPSLLQLGKLQGRILKCIFIDQEQKRDRSAALLSQIDESRTLLLENLNLSKVRANNPTKQLADHPLYAPDGSEITGSTIEEKLEKHRRIWVTHSLERVTPLLEKIDLRYAEIQQELAANPSPQQRARLQKELHQLQQAKQEANKVLAEARSFKGRDPQIAKLADKLERSLGRSPLPVLTPPKTIRTTDTQPNRHFKSVFEKSSPPSNSLNLNIPTKTAESSFINEQPTNAPTQNVASKKISQTTPLPRTTTNGGTNKKALPSSLTSGTVTLNNVNSPIQVLTSYHDDSAPKVMLTKEVANSNKGKTIIKRLPQGTLFGLIDTQKKLVSIYKKEQDQEVLVTKKNISQLASLGIKISEKDISRLNRISITQKEVIFEYSNGNFEVRSLENVLSIDELKTLF